MKLRTIAIDDEPLALRLVSDYISKTPFLELVGAFDNPLDAIDFLSSQSVDVIFVDIQMPDLTGIEFARSLEDAPKIVFTTAYEKYALEGFKLNAIDYLLKPFSYEEFLKAAESAKAIRIGSQFPPVDRSKQPVSVSEIGIQNQKNKFQRYPLY